MGMQRRNLAPALAALVLVTLAGSISEASERRWTVRLDEPFEVGGTIYARGTLVLEHHGSYTPGTSFLEVCVDGNSLGLFQVARVESAVAPTEDRLIFERAASGHLVLVGYSSPAHRVHGEFRFAGAAVTGGSPLVASR